MHTQRLLVDSGVEEYKLYTLNHLRESEKKTVLSDTKIIGNDRRNSQYNWMVFIFHPFFFAMDEIDLIMIKLGLN